MKPSGNTILITGGASGIGRALAERLHARGNDVIIAGRRQELLDTVTAANPGMSGVRVDLTDAAGLATFAAEIGARFPTLNVLVNNAGITGEQDLSEGASGMALTRSIIDTNIVSVLELTAALLPQLLRNADPAIVTTTSGLAFVPRANYATYCASKAFLHSWLQSLRSQLSGAGIEILELAPPYVQTELGGPAQAADPAAMPLDAYADEVMSILERGDITDGEILVERVKGLRFAERNGSYAAIYASLNGG